MLYSLNSLQKTIKDMINSSITSLKNMDIFTITGVNLSTHTFSIKRLNIQDSYDNVEILGLGLGNGRCQMRLPSVNDVVLVAFISNSEKPVILGTLYDTLSTEKDQIIQLKDGEYYVNAQVNGAFLFFKEDNTIILRTPNGAKIKMSDDGSFKLFDKNNYGITSDGNGNIDIYGDVTFHGSVSDLTDGDSATVTSNNPKTSGSW